MTAKMHWIYGNQQTDQSWAEIDEKWIKPRGWQPLNRMTTMLLLALDQTAPGQELVVGVYVFQLVPHTEPIWIDEEHRGTGLAQQMADEMVAQMERLNVQGYYAIASNPVSAKMCRERGYELVTFPVYVGGSRR